VPTKTYKALANVTLGAAASSVTFSSIPATYRDLVVVVTALGSTTLEGRIRLNSDSGNNYSYVRMSSSGSAASSANAGSQSSGFLSVIADATASGPLTMFINIMDYSATDKHKTIISRAAAAGTGTEAFANRWADTSAVTTVQILTSTGNWASGATFNLFGIEA
jgi:hypothetical protein